MTIVSKLRAAQRELEEYYYERASVIDILLTAVIAKQHMVIYGPPGTGKSDVIRAVMSHVTGATLFTKLMTKTTTPDETEGAVDVPRMMSTGEYRRRRQGKLTDCHVAFLDEVFKSNSMILNTMLMVMNEREYEEEGVLNPCPLMSVLAASNELPESKELVAFADRFIFRCETKYLTPSNRAKLHRRTAGTRYTPTTMITLQELIELQNEVDNVVTPESINQQFDKLLALCDGEGLTLSDRAACQAKRVMTAHAVLHGRGTVTDDDLEILENVLWKDPKDRPIVSRLVATVTNPLKAKAAELFDIAKGVYTVVAPMFSQAPTSDAKRAVMDASAKLSQVQAQIAEVKQAYDGANVAPLDTALTRVDHMVENTVLWLMGKSERMTEV